MPTEAEIAGDLKMPLSDLQHLVSELRGLDLGSLQALASEEGREEDVHKYLPNGPDEDPFYLCMQSEMRQCLARVVAELTERERHVLALYYVEELTRKEVGAVLGLGEGRISQIHSSILLRLRVRMRQLLTPGCLQGAEVQSTKHEAAAWRRF
jgi:RNA polymerase sigma factor for flagellar operon FliA